MRLVHLALTLAALYAAIITAMYLALVRGIIDDGLVLLRGIAGTLGALTHPSRSGHLTTLSENG